MNMNSNPKILNTYPETLNPEPLTLNPSIQFLNFEPAESGTWVDWSAQVSG